MKLRAYTVLFCDIALCSSLALACSSSNGSDEFTMGGGAGTTGPDPGAGGASAGSAGSAGHSAGGSSGAASGGSGNAAGSGSVAGSGNVAGGGNTGGTGNVGGSGNVAGAGNAGAGGAGGDCGNHATDIELVPGPNSTYMEWCFDPCDPTWISITDPNGKSVPIAQVACAASPYWLTEGESQLFDGKSGGQCLPAGRYVAKVCTRKGNPAIAEEGLPPAPGSHVQDVPVEPRIPCTPKGDPVCQSVPFDYPGDPEVTVTLDQ
jgi:hypothetical protein